MIRGGRFKFFVVRKGERPVHVGIGGALRTCFEISDEGDERMRELIARLDDLDMGEDDEASSGG